ncbi:hypothetical protein ACW9HJ_22895 [Nocardia gipuzkoensis]
MTDDTLFPVVPSFAVATASGDHHFGIASGWAAIEAGHRDRVEQRRQQR